MDSVVLTILLAAYQPAPAIVHFSGVYDVVKHRQYIPTCPPLDDVMPHVIRIRKLWEVEGARRLERVRSVTAMPSFPNEPIVAYIVSCGGGISDPLTVAIYADAVGGGLQLQTDEAVLRDIVHELLHVVALSDDYDRLWRRIQREL